MKNRPRASEIQRKTPDYSYVPAITTVALPLLFGKTKNLQIATQPPQELSLKTKPKPKSISVAKYEVSDNIVKFFDAKGFPKKRWVLIKEIPIREISSLRASEMNLT